MKVLKLVLSAHHGLNNDGARTGGIMTEQGLVKLEKSMSDNSVPDTFNVKINRELSLLGNGIKDGFTGRLNQLVEQPGMTALEIVGAAAVGGTLAALDAAGGARGKTIAHVSGVLLGVIAAGDVLTRTAWAGTAMYDTWNNPGNFDQNKKEIANSLGSAFVDYPLMGLSGVLGGMGARNLAHRFTYDPNIAFPGTPLEFDRRHVRRAPEPIQGETLAKPKLPIGEELYGHRYSNAFYQPSYLDAKGVRQPGILHTSDGKGNSWETKVDVEAIANMFKKGALTRPAPNYLTILPFPLYDLEGNRKF